MVQTRLRKLLDNLAQDFDINKLSKSSARFNLEKLNWFNREYIKMMSLEEFVFRASLNNLTQTHADKKLRVGDYAFLADLKEQKVFVQVTAGGKKIRGQAGLVGGGREAGETWEQGLIREVQEETLNRIIIEPSKAIKIIQGNAVFDFGNENYDSKSFNIYYYYSISVKDLTSYTYYGDVPEGETFDWMEMGEFFEQSKFLPYAVWKNFCEDQNLPCLEPNENIKLQYLAYLLDKNRATKLSDLGSESDCVLNWRKPAMEDLKWKKISLEESLDNLKEIYDSLIHDLLQNSQAQKLKSELLEAVLTPLVDDKFNQTASYFETGIKNWVSQNNRDMGSYLWPLRLALSGKAKSPSPFELLAVLTPEQVNDRIKECLEENN
jgi:glutamyl/glutaminyl-tRNA synthetase